MSIASFRDLLVWEKFFNLVKTVYSITRSLPASEIYGLTSQLQRCSVSIPSNIAEGQQRNSTKEFRQFLGIARESCAELETQLLLVGDLYSIPVKPALIELNQIQRMLYAIIKKLD